MVSENDLFQCAGIISILDDDVSRDRQSLAGMVPVILLLLPVYGLKTGLLANKLELQDDKGDYGNCPFHEISNSGHFSPATILISRPSSP
jgi:hypothetical protein